MDPSFPVGCSVNDGIPKDTFLGEPFQLCLPGVEALATLIHPCGPNCLIFKKDLHHAYRQFPIDPRDYHYLGYSFDNLLFFDTVFAFGLRPATMACQCVTNAIQFLHSLQGYFSTNYVDDFGGCDTPERATDSFHALQHLFHFLGIDSATEKDCPPSTFMVFLGILFNTVTMTMSIPQEKLSELLQLIQHISHANHITRHSLQSLLGLMSYVTACVRPARIFMAALLNGLCGLPRHATSLITDDIRADLEWWLHFLPKYNGISIIPPIVYNPQIVVTDACHTGGGGHFGYKCFHVDFPPHLITDSAYDINVKEILTVIVALRLWGPSCMALVYLFALTIPSLFKA